MSAELAKREPTTLEIIGQIANAPNFDADKMAVVERMIALKERTDVQDRKNAYAAAMAALQAELPQIDKNGRIMQGFGTDAKVRSTYARIEDIDEQIRPYLAKHGFSFSWNTADAPVAGEVRYVGTMTHSAGHSEDKHIDLPIEDELSSSGKLMMTRVQKRKSTLSFATRMLLIMHCNLISRDVDNDGQGNPETISAKELATIKDQIAATETDVPMFLQYMKVEKFEDIHRRDVPKATAALRAKASKKASEAK